MCLKIVYPATACYSSSCLQKRGRLATTQRVNDTTTIQAASRCSFRYKKNHVTCFALLTTLCEIWLSSNYSQHCSTPSAFVVANPHNSACCMSSKVQPAINTKYIMILTCRIPHCDLLSSVAEGLNLRRQYQWSAGNYICDKAVLIYG